MTDRKKNPTAPRVDMDNLYGSWKYPKVTSEHVSKAVAKMNKDHNKKKEGLDEGRENNRP